MTHVNPQISWSDDEDMVAVNDLRHTILLTDPRESFRQYSNVPHSPTGRNAAAILAALSPSNEKNGVVNIENSCGALSINGLESNSEWNTFPDRDSNYEDSRCHDTPGCDENPSNQNQLAAQLEASVTGDFQGFGVTSFSPIPDSPPDNYNSPATATPSPSIPRKRTGTGVNMSTIRSLSAMEADFFAGRDFSHKGRFVRPTARQQAEVRRCAEQIVMNEPIGDPSIIQTPPPKHGKYHGKQTPVNVASKSKKVTHDKSNTMLEGGITRAESASAAMGDVPSSFSVDVTNRICIAKGHIRQIYKERVWRKTPGRWLFLFNDVIILTNSTGASRQSPRLHVRHVLFLCDLAISHFPSPSKILEDIQSARSAPANKRTSARYPQTSSPPVNSSSKSAQTAQSNKSSTSTSSSSGTLNSNDQKFQLRFYSLSGSFEPLILQCDDEQSFRQWVELLENTLLAYHLQTSRTTTIGWFHDILRGTLHSAAALGDLKQVSQHIQRSLAVMTSDKSFSENVSATTSSTTNKVIKTAIGMLVNGGDLTGMNPLHWACLRGHLPIVALLVKEYGASLTAVQQGWNTPLHLAVAGGHEDVTLFLLENGANPDLRNHRGHDFSTLLLLHGYEWKSFPKLLQQSVDRGVDFNRLDAMESSPLLLCAERNLSRSIRHLLRLGVNVGVIHPQTRRTALHGICRHINPDVEIVRALIQRGVKINWRDSRGFTALDLLLRRRPKPVTQVLQNPGMGSTSFLTSDGSFRSSFGGTLAALASMMIPDDDVADRLSYGTSGAGEDDEEITVIAGSIDRWRPMEDTIRTVGDWAVQSLPPLLELVRRGARFSWADLSSLRSSFQAAILAAKQSWDERTTVTVTNSCVSMVEVERLQSVIAPTFPANISTHPTNHSAAGDGLSCMSPFSIMVAVANDTENTYCTLCNEYLGEAGVKCDQCNEEVCTRCRVKKLVITGTVDNVEDNETQCVCDQCFNRY